MFAASTLFAAQYNLNPSIVDSGGGRASASNYSASVTVGGIVGVSISDLYTGVYGFEGQLSTFTGKSVNVTINASPEAGGETDPSGTVSVLAGQPESITATPSETYKFLNWSVEGDATVADETLASTTFTAEGDATVTANFYKATIQVIQPNGGESLKQGSVETIKWQSSNVSGNIRIELYLKDTIYEVVAGDLDDDGEYEWVVGSDLDAGSSYKIRIVSVDDPTVNDFSDSAFSIETATIGTLTLTAPDGGEQWQIGKTHEITWTADYFVGMVSLKLYKDGLFIKNIAQTTINNGSYSWIIPSDVDAANDYFVRIASFSNNDLIDISDGFFSVVSYTPPDETITVTSPNGGEVWAPGSTQTITWTSEGVPGAVKLELYQEDSLISTISESVDDSGTYSWTVPDVGAPACDFRIRISSVDNANINDMSDNYFTVSSSTTASLSLVVSPENGGVATPQGTTTVNVGEKQEISAIALDGYTFSKWVTESAGVKLIDQYSKKAQIIISGDAAVTAIFAKDEDPTSVNIKINNSKSNKDSINIKKAVLGYNGTFDQIDEFTFEIDDYSYGPVKADRFTQKGTKQVYQFSSDKETLPKVKITLDFEKLNWSFNGKKMDGLVSLINNIDGVSIVLGIKDGNAAYQDFGKTVTMTEKTSWSFKSSKNTSSDSVGTDFAIDKASGKYKSDKSKSNKDSFKINKATLSPEADFNSSLDPVSIQIDDVWQVTIFGDWKRSGDKRTYSWNGTSQYDESKVKFKLDLEKGSWNFSMSKGNLDGVSAADGLNIDLIVGSYIGGINIQPTVKSTLKYKTGK